MAGDLKIDARRRRILEILNRDGSVKVSQLSETLGATPVTIRADLTALEKDEYLERTTGGAILTSKNVFKVDSMRRMQVNIAQKKMIAAKTAELVNDGQTLILNSGSTAFLTAIELKQRKNLNILTNSTEVALELGSQPTFHVVLLGGEINAQYGFTFGNDAMAQLRNYKADFAIMAIDGICSDIGITTFHVEEAAVDRAMIDRARRVVIVADSSKYEHEGFSFVSDLRNVSTWITDTGLDKDSAKKIEALGVEVIIAGE